MKHIVRSFVVWVLEKQAAMLLRRTKPMIIAVAGNVGKTSTKDAIFSVIAHSFHVRKSNKSFNSEISVPLTILGLPNAWSSMIGWVRNILRGFRICLFPGKYPRVLVLEIGADKPGDIQRIAAYIKPDVLVMTAIPEVPVHVEAFGTPEALVEEKRAIARALKPQGTLTVDADSQYSAETRHLALPTQKVISYGIHENADIQLIETRLNVSEFKSGTHTNVIPLGVKGDIVFGDEVGIAREVALPGVLGEHTFYPVLAACAVGLALNLDKHTVISRVADVEHPRGRMCLLDGIKGSVLIDDTYNSSPVAALEALKALKSIKTRRHRIAVLGDMLELGDFSRDAHYALGTKVASYAKILITVGMRARAIAEGALAGGMPETHVIQCDTREEAEDIVQQIVREGDIVLIKGSQRMRLEKLVKGVMAQPDQAEKLLVRQEKEWINR